MSSIARAFSGFTSAMRATAHLKGKTSEFHRSNRVV
jgi:hypothetical protein